jgi:tetratricopeptide (TPR) repeat protein
MAVDQKSDPNQDLLKKADQLRLAGSYDQARILLQELIKSNPFFAPAKLGLGRVYFESGDLVNAKSVLEEFSEFVPDHALANKILAKIYIYFSQFNKAQEKINSVLSANPEDSMAKKMLQEIQDANSFQEEDLNNEDTKKNTIPTSTATIAEIYRSQGHLAEALEIYKQLLQQSANNPLYIQNIHDIEAQLNPVSATAETVELHPDPEPQHLTPEPSFPEFKRVEVTDERVITPMAEFGAAETVELEPNYMQPKAVVPVEVEEFVEPLVENNPNRKTRQEKLERMLYLVQQHRKGVNV